MATKGPAVKKIAEIIDALKRYQGQDRPPIVEKLREHINREHPQEGKLQYALGKVPLYVPSLGVASHSKAKRRLDFSENSSGNKENAANGNALPIEPSKKKSRMEPKSKL